MTEEEATILLKQKIIQTKDASWSLMGMLLTADKAMLSNMGYGKCSSGKEAVGLCFESARANIEKLIKAHEKAFPMRNDQDED